MKKYFDGNGAVLGRLGSSACKELLKGHEVVIINSEKVLVSGNKDNIIDEMLWWKNLGGKGMKGPKVSRLSDRLLKRMIRGMLPWNRQKGRDAYDRLKCYIGNGSLKQEELKQVAKIHVKKPIKYMSLEEISKLI